MNGFEFVGFPPSPGEQGEQFSSPGAPLSLSCSVRAGQAGIQGPSDQLPTKVVTIPVWGSLLR